MYPLGNPSSLQLVVLPFSLLAQSTTVVIEYMKVTQESERAYLEVEKEWMKIHQKQVDEGIFTVWPETQE